MEKPGAFGASAAVYDMAVYMKKVVDNVSANGYTNKACAWMHCFVCPSGRKYIIFQKEVKQNADI